MALGLINSLIIADEIEFSSTEPCNEVFGGGADPQVSHARDHAWEAPVNLQEEEL